MSSISILKANDITIPSTPAVFTTGSSPSGDFFSRASEAAEM